MMMTQEELAELADLRQRVPILTLIEGSVLIGYTLREMRSQASRRLKKPYRENIGVQFDYVSGHIRAMRMTGTEFYGLFKLWTNGLDSTRLELPDHYVRLYDWWRNWDWPVCPPDILTGPHVLGSSDIVRRYVGIG